jgi:regulation of enolase protein 1 (concanavalin A-like superfamily)
MMVSKVARHLAPLPARPQPVGAGTDPVVGFSDPRMSWLNHPSGWEGALPADADSETEGFGGSATVADDGSTLTLAPPAKKDFWRRTFYEPTMIKGDASALLCEVGAEEEATLELTFSFVAVEQFDQCGAFVYIDETHWLKAGIEWADGAPRLSCVCCNVFSDWSVMPWEGTAAKIRLHKVNQGQALVMEANTLDGGDDDWQFVRICHLSPQVGDKSIGVNDEPSAAGSSTLKPWRMGPFGKRFFVEPEFSVPCVAFDTMNLHCD